MIVRSICYFKTRGERRVIKSDKRGRPVLRDLYVCVIERER